MVVATIGAAMMRGGAKIAGKAMAKSQAGGILASKDLGELKKIVELSKKNNDHLKKIKDNTSKSALYSPALQQQLIVLGKSFQLLIRPIGDILAKFIAPFARVGIVFFMKAYKRMSDGSSLLGGKTDTNQKQDEEKQLIVERKEAVIRGDTDAVEEIDKKLYQVWVDGQEYIEKWLQSTRQHYQMSEEEARTYLSNELQNKDSNWKELEKLDLSYIKEIHEKEKEKNDERLVSGQSFLDDQKSAEDDAQDKIEEDTGIWYGDLDTIHDTGMTNISSTITTKYKDLVDSLKSSSIIKPIDYGDISGGPHSSTSPITSQFSPPSSYNIPKKSNEGNPISFNSVFNIAATVTNNEDIKTLADKLAAFFQIELKRRVA